MSGERGAARFSGLEKIISARGRSTSIDFSAKVIASGDRRTGEVFRDVEPEDLLKYGLIPEFVGRLPVVATLEDLDESAFRIRFFGRTTSNLACSYLFAARLRVRSTRHVAPQRLDALAPRLAKQAKLGAFDGPIIGRWKLCTYSCSVVASPV
jgi:hypothetical protein